MWKEVFGVLAPLVEMRECQDAIEFQDEYKKKLAKLTIEIQQRVSSYEEKGIATIEDDTNTPPPNPNVLTKEKIKGLMKDSRKLCTKPIFVQVIDYPMLEVNKTSDFIVTPVIEATNIEQLGKELIIYFPPNSIQILRKEVNSEKNSCTKMVEVEVA